MKEKAKKSVKMKKSMKKLLSVTLAVAMLSAPLSPFPVEWLFPAGKVEAAAVLPMPKEPGYRLLNKVLSDKERSYRYSYSMGPTMEKTGSSGGSWIASVYGDTLMDGVTVFGKGSSWSVTFEDKDFQQEVYDEVMFRMGGAVSNYKGSSVRMGNGTSFGESCSEDGLTKDYATGWLPFNGMKAVVKGSGPAEVTYLWYVLADITAPGEKGWKMEITTDAGANTPILWLSCTETLRPANAEITTGDLANMKLELGLVPRKNPGGDQVNVKAEAVQLSSDSRGIGFRITASDWERISGKEYQIVSIKNASEGKNYKLIEYSGTDPILTVNQPITDIAGNPVQLPGSALNVKAQGLILDVLPPSVEAVKLTGSSVDTSMKTSPEQWPADIDRSKLFSTVGDQVQLRLQLSEVVVHPSDREMGNIVLTWNIGKNGQPVTSRLTAIEEGYSNGVNGGIVSTLVFEKITITENMQPQGERLHPVSLRGGELLRDYSKNVMAPSGGVLDVSNVGPDCHNYLDTAGPVAEIGQIVKSETEGDGVYYIVPMTIRDGSDGILAAGIAGQTARISLTSYANAPQMTYEYEISRSMEKPGNLTQKGTVGGEGNEIWSSFTTPDDGTYYLHLRLTDTADKELDDNKGLTLKLQLTDILSNASETVLKLEELALDNGKPQLTLTQKSINVSADSSTATGLSVSAGDADSAFSVRTGNNTATFEVEAQASDLNGILRMEYQWTDAGAAAAENGWIVVSSDGTDPMRQIFTDSVSGEQAVSRTLHVRAVDKYENRTEKTLTVTADLSKAVGQFRVVGDPETPSADTDVMIARPIATGEGTGIENASTRAIVEIGGNTYVRIFRDSEPKSLLDKDAADWYQVIITEDGKDYLSVTEGQKPDWSFYGPITVRLAHSLKDLSPAEGGKVDAADSGDITFVQDDSLTVLYAPLASDVHEVTFSGVKNSAGETVSPTTASGYTYYKMNRSMTGARFSFTLTNRKEPEWKVKDVDFTASYAVLVKTDAQGNPLPDAEVTDRILLSGGESQSFSVPSSGKDGNPFASGAYTLKVYVQQKAGSGQTIYSDTPLLLDASGIPTQFGVLSYTSATQAAYLDRYDSSSELSRTYEAEAGDVLHTINVGVARPDELDLEMDNTGLPTEAFGALMEIGGHTAYLTAAQNALNGSRFSDNRLVDEFSLQLTAKWSEAEKPGEYLGVQLGRVTGIKYWNAASTGNPTELSYDNYYIIGIEGDSSAVMTTLSADLKWYAKEYAGCVVSPETLSGKQISDFALALGGNTICYQLRMENGLESPVYQFELNLCDQAPTVELEYSFGPSVLRRDDIDVTSTSTALTKYAEYIDVSIKDAFSVYGGLTVYHASYDDAKKQWIYKEVEQDGTIRLTKSGNGYAGFLGTNAEDMYKNHTTREFICVVDAVGNAVSAYPILADAAIQDQGYTGNEKKYYYGIKDNCALFSVEAPSLIENSAAEEYRIQFTAGEEQIKRIMDYYTLQIDDREPVLVDLGWDDYWYHFQNISNHAGITRGDDCEVDFVLPYDPAAGEGAQISHTVKITAYGYRETPDSQPPAVTREFTVTGTNRKPRVEIVVPAEGSASIGSVPIRTTACVQDSGVGIPYSNNSDMKVYSNGTYILNLKDKYGEEYTQELTVDCLPEDPKITISTRKPTAGPVIITATSERYLLKSNVPDMAGNSSGGGEEDPSPSPSPSPQNPPASVGEDSGELVITVPANPNNEIYIYWYEKGAGNQYENSTSISIGNIDSAAIEPQIQWQYDETMVEDGNIYRGEVTAILTDRNGKILIDPLTGSRPSYVFAPGGETRYTFSGYVDESGKKGPDITATLPVTLLAPKPQIEGAADTYAPDLAITGYVIRGGVSSEVQAAYVQSHDRPEGSRVGLSDYGDENKYGPENVFSDMQDMVDRMFWAESYLLRVETADESAVRLFVRNSAEGAPDYETGKSDAIEGVSLTGRTVQIGKNVEFVLYAVDEKNNYSMVPIKVTALGELPDPEYAQVLTKTGGAVHVYLLPPDIEGISNLQITNDDDNDGKPDASTETDSDSAFYGRQYLAVTENKEIMLYYSYHYFDIKREGSLKITVSGIDVDPVVAKKTEWSANYDPSGEKYTNQEISVQIQFDKPLGKVTLTDAKGTVLGENTGTVTAAWLENRVTVVYEGNAPGYLLKVQPLANSRETVIELPEIKTIDKTPPAVLAAVEYAKNHRSAVVTITSDEEGYLSRSGKIGTTFRQTVKENGTFTYSVVDRAGNQGQVSVEVKDMVTEDLTLLLSTGGTDASVIDPETYEAGIGDLLYAKTNRKAKLSINGKEIGEAAAGTWTQFTITEDSEGLYPGIRAVDAYGNAALVQLTRIPMRDRTAPVLLLMKNQLSASAEKSDGDLEALLLSNAVYSDDTTPKDRLDIKVEFERSSGEGRIPATYTVTDEAGNTTQAVCWLRLYDGSEPRITVNGSPVEWGETMAVERGTQTIRILTEGEPIKVYRKTGIKTEAQMKTGSVLLSGYTGETEQEFTEELTEPGYYTFCIVTQGRRTYRFVLYVEE